MKNIDRQLAGWKAKFNGKNWERDFEVACAVASIACVRIPNGCRSIGRNRLVRVRSPFDYVLGYGARIACVDLKSFVAGKSLSHSQIDPGQLSHLLALSRDGIAGYIVYYKSTGDVVFYDAERLAGIKPRASLGIADGSSLGTVSDLDLHALFLRSNKSKSDP